MPMPAPTATPIAILSSATPIAAPTAVPMIRPKTSELRGLLLYC
jgi:hypothetical protein